MQILFTLIDESIRLGDKILVFSQSLLTLNLMEELLAKRDVPGTDEKWTKNKNYYSKLPFWTSICIVTAQKSTKSREPRALYGGLMCMLGWGDRGCLENMTSCRLCLQD